MQKSTSVSISILQNALTEGGGNPSLPSWATLT